MEPQSTDRRIRRSIRLIKDSFFALAREKPLSTITVMDICTRADINRCTFYAHYENREALLRELEEDLALMFSHAFSLYTFDRDSHEAIDALFDCIRKNPELISFASQIGRLGKGNKALEKAIRDHAYPEWIAGGKLSFEQALLLEAYITSGGVQIIEKWIESDFTLDEDMVKDVFENVIKYGLYYYVRA
ncbi:MAG: TetR/AcrR family transcriptional regulator [Coriobacteriales bacterium]|jgi:AcrR family transcriptional regulator|nr:TetR/AcrR family transcriptional regulator [Coriobacteriales bacterium]